MMASTMHVDLPPNDTVVYYRAAAYTPCNVHGGYHY